MKRICLFGAMFFLVGCSGMDEIRKDLKGINKKIDATKDAVIKLSKEERKTRELAEEAKTEAKELAAEIAKGPRPGPPGGGGAPAPAAPTAAEIAAEMAKAFRKERQDAELERKAEAAEKAERLREISDAVKVEVDPLKARLQELPSARAIRDAAREMLNFKFSISPEIKLWPDRRIGLPRPILHGPFHRWAYNRNQWFTVYYNQRYAYLVPDQPILGLDAGRFLEHPQIFIDPWDTGPHW